MNHYTATLPDGTTATRGTKNTYSHCVAGATSAGRIRKDCADALRVYAIWEGQGDDVTARRADVDARLATIADLADDDIADWGILSFNSTEALAVKTAAKWAPSFVRTVVLPVN